MGLDLISGEAEGDTCPVALKGEDEGSKGSGLWYESGEYLTRHELS